MTSTVPEQHPAVVLRSHFLHVRALLAVAMVAIVAMAVAIVVLASAGTSAPPSSAARSSSGTTRYDGGPEEGTRGPHPSPAVRAGRHSTADR